MPDTRPGLVIDPETGICSACRHAEQKETINWQDRQEYLKFICDEFRRDDGYYDCIVPVSGGKDSYFATYIIKEKMHMNPLLVSVSNLFTTTKTGEYNLRNLGDVFGCDILSLSLNRKVARHMVRKAFEELGSPTWCYDRAIYTWPMQVAMKYNIKLIIYGENTSYEYGGPLHKETFSAIDQINNDAVKDVGGLEYWLDEKADITMKDMQPYIFPSQLEIAKSDLNPVYLSFFMKWSGYHNMVLAKEWGFKTLDDTSEWDRKGYIEDFDQIDSLGYLTHIFMKYPKFGHCRATDVASIWVRESGITREEAIELVREHDHLLDPRALYDFLSFTGYTDSEFWQIVDKFYNRDLFDNINGNWVLKHPVWGKHAW